MINPEVQFRFDRVESPQAETFVGRWTIPADLAYFQGHFPGYPVLPAVAVLDGTLEFLKSGLGKRNLEWLTLKSAKFTQPLQPGQTVEIQISRKGEGWECDWVPVLVNGVNGESSGSAGPKPAVELVFSVRSCI